MTISTVPEFPAIGDATFNAKAYAFGTHMVDTFVDEANALATAVNVDSVAATTQKVLAAAEAISAHNEATAAASAALASGAVVWVTGLAYAVGDVRYSPLTYLVYRRIVAGAGSTDPSLDSTNWVVLVDSPIPTTVVITATGTWTCPAHIRKAKVTVVGGGASGSSATSQAGGGGGGGGTAIKTLAVTPGTVYTVTIGAGGTAVPPGAGSGVTGGTSSFAGTGITTVFGIGGSGSSSPTDGGAGGGGTNGDLIIPGDYGTGAAGNASNPLPMGGGTFMAGRSPVAGVGYGGGGGSIWNAGGSYAGAAGVVIVEY